MTLSSLVDQIRLIKSEMVCWLDKPKWLNRLTLYFTTFALVIGISYFTSLHYGFLHTSVDSARYMLSALVQSEAAILAMVITLSLVAMQLVASSNSVGVIEDFAKTPDLRILIVVYGFAIFYGLGVLKLIEGACPVVDSMSNLEAHISFAYYFGIFAFIALIHYIRNTFNLLKSSVIINMLAERITKKNILDVIERQEKTGDKDRIQPIIDIVCDALVRRDYATIRDGLRAIGDRADHIFKNNTFKYEEESGKIAKHIFDHLTDVGRIAASRYDEKSTVEVIDNLYKNGETLVKQKYIFATTHAVDSLGMIGVTAAERKLGKAAEEAASAIGQISAFAAEHAAELQRMGGIVNNAKAHLAAIQKSARNSGLEDAFRRADAAIRLINEIVEKQGKP